MAAEFEIGGYVTWNSKARHVSGKIIKVHKKISNTRIYLPREPE